MSKSIMLAAALMASLAMQASATPTIKFAPKPEERAVGLPKTAAARRLPEHHTYPAYLLRQHEVRKGDVSDYVASIFGPSDHSYSLRDSESFYWGLNGMPLNNFTTYAHESNVKILSLERHSDVINTAKCTTDSVRLHFDPDHFTQVQQAWSWVNSQHENKIMLVTDNSECNIPDGDPTLRQPWEVSTITFDSETGYVTLDATHRTWEEAFPSWRFQGASTPIVPNPTHKDQATKVKRVTISAAPNIPVVINLDGKGISIPDTPVTLTCDPCHTSGELDFNFDIVPYAIPPKLTGTFQVQPKGLSASLAAKIAASGGFDGKGFQDTIFDAPIPDAGINIGNLVSLGFNLKLEAAGNIGKIDAEVSATAGIQVTIPDSSNYVLNFDDDSKDINTGWSPVVTPILDINANVAISASVGPQLTLELDAEIAKVGGAIGLALAGPTFSAEAKLEADSAGVCDSDNIKAGVEIDMNISADLFAFASANLIVAHPAVTKTFFATNWPIFSTCVGIPGASVATSTPVTTTARPTTTPPFPITNGTVTTAAPAQ